jgi:type II secretory pathway pseudopilin PulG
MKREKLKEQLNFNAQKLTSNKAITLIALVVTIVVLLILAGISISLVIGDNGLIQKSRDAKLETRAGTVEDEVTVWKQNNVVSRSLGNGADDPDAMIQGLIDRGLLNEDEIDREQEIITIKRKNGSIVKQISYSNVNINISKTPETEKSRVVILNVTSVEGMTIPNIKTDEEYEDFVNSLSQVSQDRKKELIKKMLPEYVNKTTADSENPTNYKTFEDAVKWGFKGSEMEIPTENLEEEFWKAIEKRDGGIDEFFYECIMTVCFNMDTEEIKGYRVTNPDGEESSTYIAKENGIYAFKVEDLVTGKIYTKKVEVTNVDKTLPEFIVTSEKIENGTEMENGLVTIYLKDVIENNYTTFEKAYIIYNNEKIEITDAILEYKKEGQVVFNRTGLWNIGVVLKRKGKIESIGQLENTDQMIILVKDNVEYFATINMGKFVPPVE